MKAYIYETEWYPVWDIDKNSLTDTELPDELIARYDTVMEAFEKMQQELKALYYVQAGIA